MTAPHPLPPLSVLLVEDEPDVREAVRTTLDLEGFTVHEASDGQDALDLLARLGRDRWPGVVVSDVRMPRLDGLGLLDRLMAEDRDLPVVLVTGHGEVAMALSAIRQGAYDFIEKPVTPDRLIDVVRRASHTRTLVLENRDLRRRVAGQSPLDSRIIGQTPAMQSLRALIQTMADANVDVLIHGETGTGKELVARALHDFGPRRSGAFVALNCGALPESVIESELFGHEPGAFTGALKRRIGKIEHASGGTLFLDEIETMPMHLQVKLLRVLQERVIERLGGNTQHPVDLRVVAATKADLLDLAAAGRFRDDFYYRIGVAHLDLPALRDRRDDIPLLFCHFVDQAAIRLNRPAPDILPAHLEDLISRPWQGNVRELRNVADRFVLGISRRLTLPATPTQSPSQTLPALTGAASPHPTGPHATGSGVPLAIPGSGTLDDRLEVVESQIIADALQANRGRIQDTANALGIPRKKLYLRMRRFGLDKGQFRDTLGPDGEE